MRIVYLIDSVSEVGGIQSVTVQKVNALAKISGNEVWLILTDNTKQQFYRVSEKVHTINLDINYYKDDWKSNWHVFKGILFKRIRHKRLLTGVLRVIKPDIVVSTGTSEKYLILRIRGEWARVREIHSIRSYRHLAATSLFQRISASIGDLLDYKFSIKKFDRIVVLTRSDKEYNWTGYNNVIVIPNPVSPLPFAPSPLTEKRIVAMGRLVLAKGFSHLIRSFKLVSDRYPDWTLDIWGDGSNKTILEEEIKKNGLSGHIFLRGTSNSIQQVLRSYSVFVCTSLYEGFGLTIVEAMSCGLPVVSFNCDYGPGEIIDEGKDGFLVPVGDEKMLAEKISVLIDNENMRKRMGRAAIEKSKQFDTDRIMAMWMDLFRQLYKEKRK